MYSYIIVSVGVAVGIYVGFIMYISYSYLVPGTYQNVVVLSDPAVAHSLYPPPLRPDGYDITRVII